MSTRTPSEHDFLYSQALGNLQNMGLRQTQTRETLLRAVLSFSRPFDAETLLHRAQEIDGSISMPTVYRNLPFLIKTGLIREVDLRNGRQSYEFHLKDSVPSAGYIVCSDCKKVIDVQDDCLKLREAYLAHTLGFVPKKSDLRIEASCKQLHETGHCDRAAN